MRILVNENRKSGNKGLYSCAVHHKRCEAMKRKKPIINYYIIVINGGQGDEHDTLYKVLTLLVSIASLIVAIVLR